jgi:hypothetical protein
VPAAVVATAGEVAPGLAPTAATGVDAEALLFVEFDAGLGSTFTTGLLPAAAVEPLAEPEDETGARDMRAILSLAVWGLRGGACVFGYARPVRGTRVPV